MNSPSLPEPFITAKGSSCGLGDRIWGINSGAGADTPGGRIRKEGGELGFLSPPPPSPATTEPHTPPLPPKSDLCRFLGTVVSRTVLINRQARGGWWHKLQIPGLPSQSWQQQSWAQASSGKSLSSPWRLTPSWPVLRPSPCLWLTEHSGICSQVLSVLQGLPTHAERGSSPRPVKTTGATTH